jgi:hypothetical protein
MVTPRDTLNLKRLTIKIGIFNVNQGLGLVQLVEIWSC